MKTERAKFVCELQILEQCPHVWPQFWLILVDKVFEHICMLTVGVDFQHSWFRYFSSAV